MSGRHSLTRTTLFTGTSKGVEGLGSLLATLIVARYLGPAGYGTYATVVSMVMLLWPLVDMGLDQVIVRDIVTEGVTPSVIGTGLVLRFAAGVLCSAGLMAWVLIDGMGPHFVAATVLAVANILLVRQVSNLVCRALFLGVERVDKDAIATTAGQVVRLGGLLVVARLDLGLLWILGVPIVAEVVQVGLGLMLAHRHLGGFRVRVSLARARHLLRQSWPLLLRLILVTAYFHIDNVVLARMLPAEDLGLFAAPFRLVAGLVMVVVPTSWALLPSLVRGQRDPTSPQLMHRVGPLASAATAMLGVAFLVGSRPLITLTFGDAYRAESAVVCLRLLSLLPVLHTVCYIMELELLAAGRQQWALAGAAPALIVKIVADVSLAGLLGPVAGAVSSVVADIMRTAVLIRVARSRWMLLGAVPIVVLGVWVALILASGGFL